jgi:all-trans-retinol 13,14-reductase
MKTLRHVNFALLPFSIFVILYARGMPALAIDAALIASTVACAWRGFTREIKSLELALLAIFGGLAIGNLLFPDIVAAQAITFAFIGLGLFASASVLLRRPWTAEFSRAAYASEASHPIFTGVNMMLSGLWGALFLLLALASALKAGWAVTTAIAMFGSGTSILGPKWLIRRALSRRIAARESWRWPAPALGHAAGSDFDVAVVGAGIGGLTAAALLADAGLKVVVAEQHFQPGGFCQTFRRNLQHDGKPLVFHFDAGPHDFSGIFEGGPVTSVLERLGVAGQVEWRRIDHTYRYSGLAVDVPRDWRAYVAELGARFPAAKTGIEALFSDIRAIHDGMYSPLLASGGVPGLGMTVETLQAFPRQHPIAVQWMDRPFDQLVARHVTDPKARRLVTALTGYVSDGAESLSCAQMVPLFGYYFHGGYHPVGGSGRFAAALVSALTARGGTLWLNSPVEKITVSDGRATGLRLAGGKQVSAQAVVTNADQKRTFLELIDPAELPADFRARIGAAEPATSAFTVHLGLDFVPDIRPAVHAMDEPGIGITAMSLIDPQAAPAGCSTLTITSLQPQARAGEWFSGDWKQARQTPDYQDHKRQFGDRLIAMAEKVIPGLSDHIVYRDEASPVTFTRYDWSTLGSIYGVSQKDRLKGSKSPIQGLVVAGSSTHGPGVEAAVISGAFAADALLPGLLARPAQPERFSKKVA